MSWYEIAVLVILAIGVIALMRLIYHPKSGLTPCTGCGACRGTGNCVLRRREIEREKLRQQKNCESGSEKA